jgi:hypothetical protein
MSFDHNYSWDNFENVVRSTPSVREGWNHIIDFHQTMKKKSYWNELKALDVESEKKKIGEWLEALVTDEPFNEKVLAIWIGITKFVDEVENEVYVIYLTGCEAYDSEDIEWANEPTYIPENRYFASEVLTEMTRKISKEDDDYSLLDWILPLAYCTLMFNDLIVNALDKSKFLKHRDKIFVATGHDSGDYWNLNPIEINRL